MLNNPDTTTDISETPAAGLPPCYDWYRKSVPHQDLEEIPQVLRKFSSSSFRFRARESTVARV